MRTNPHKFNQYFFSLIGIFLFSATVTFSQESEKSYLERSREFLEIKKMKQAEQYADSALFSAIASDNLDSVMHAYLWLSNVHSVKLDHLKSLQYFKMVIVYRDSLEKMRRQEIEKRKTYEQLIRDESSEKRMASLKKSISDLQYVARHDWRNMLIILSAMFFLLVIVIMVCMRKVNNARQLASKANAELESHRFFRERLSAMISSNLQASLNSFENLAHSLSEKINDLSKEERSILMKDLGNAATEIKGGLSNVTKWISFQSDSSMHRPENFDCRELAESTIARFRKDIASKKVNTQLFMQDGIRVHADREMVEKVLEKLFSNALENTPSGGMITILSGRKDGLATLGVKDTGAQIPESKISKLFNEEPFDVRGQSDRELGLILCKELVERNGGRIYVESTFDQGNTVYFTLPSEV